jgi:hypothetical protein
VHITGDHRTTDGGKLFRYELRLYAYSGLSWLELEYTFINDADPAHTELQRISLDLPLAAQSDTVGLCGAYADLHASGEPFSIRADAPTNFGLFAGTRIFDSAGMLVESEGAGELWHRIAHGWLDVSDQHGGLRNPDHADHRFRWMPSTHSGPCRPSIPMHAVQFCRDSGIGGRHALESVDGMLRNRNGPTDPEGSGAG